MIGDYFYVFVLSPDETNKTDGWRNDYLVHLVHLVMTKTQYSSGDTNILLSG